MMMRKWMMTVVLAIMAAAPASAQETDKTWALDTRAWSTNYFTTSIINLLESMSIYVACSGDAQDSILMRRIIPNVSTVFPIGMQKSGFSDRDIYGPYHRAFGNPFKHIGDYGIGADVLYKPSFFGCYAGAYFKSQEIVYRDNGDNLRGFYFQPRAGITFGNGQVNVEAGAFYDAVTGCGGSDADTDKKRLKGGWGLDFALGISGKRSKSMGLIQFSMPLHNFFNQSYAGQQDMKRRVGYIMITDRIYL